MRRLAAWLYDHKVTVFISWGIILITLLGLSQLVGPNYKFDITLKDTESSLALEDLATHLPITEGDVLTIAWTDEEPVSSEPVKEQVQGLLDEIQSSWENVLFIDSPYVAGTAGPPAVDQINPEANIAYATVQLDMDSLHIPPDVVNGIVNQVRSEDGVDGLTIGVQGMSIAQANPPSGSASEGIGMAISAVILLMAFGSVIAAGLPLLTSLVALGASVSTVMLVTHWLSIPDFATQMVSLIGIGVGIDYALFVVSRHRTGLMQGKTVRESVLDAFDTSGRAVLFAGLTVMISILGLLVVGISFLTGLAVATSIGVLFTMLVTLTLLPALLAALGYRVLGRRARRTLAEKGPQPEAISTRWGNWSAHIQSRPVVYIIAGTVLMVGLSTLALGMHLGNPDQSVDPRGSTTRLAYDLVSDGFGPGTNGPLLLVSTPDHPEDLAPALAKVKDVPGVASVGEITLTPDDRLAFATVTPTTSPQDIETSRLITHLREDVLADSPSLVSVTGTTAVMDDFSAGIQAKLPLFLIGVLTLSSILLMIAFRSIAIPIKAALMNVLAAGASFGVLVAVFQNGWIGPLIGLDRTGPIDAFTPIMLLAILFGLSMDYQVFLVSRMKEEWDKEQDNSRAVRVGLAETGKIITAAAMIMIFVFAAFVLGDDRIIKMFGVGLAVSIFLDAFVIRSLLVPALMQVLGKWNWWMPEWLDRILPRFSIEGPSHSDEPELLGNESK